MKNVSKYTPDQWVDWNDKICCELSITKVNWFLPASTTEVLISVGVHSLSPCGIMSEHNSFSVLRNKWYMFILLIQPLPNSDIEFVERVSFLIFDYYDMWFAFIPTLKDVDFSTHIYKSLKLEAEKKFNKDQNHKIYLESIIARYF